MHIAQHAAVTCWGCWGFVQLGPCLLLLRLLRKVGICFALHVVKVCSHLTRIYVKKKIK